MLFGSRAKHAQIDAKELIEQALVASLQAKSKMTFGADGLSCHIELPLGSPVNEDLPRQLALE